MLTNRTKADAQPGRPVACSRARRRKHLGAVLLVCFGIALGLVIAEIAVRLLGLGKPEFFSYSATRGWKLRAGASGWQNDEGHAWVRVNRWGYRGPDWSEVKARTTLRIAVLGDSFVEAPQVAELNTACAVLQRRLTRMLPSLARGPYRGHQRVEVLNFGVDGYGTAQELFTLTEDVWRFSPDIVLLAFFPGNDVRNNSEVLEEDKCRPFFVPRANEVVLGGPFVDSRRFHLHCFLRLQSYRSQLLNVLGEARSAVRATRVRRPRAESPQAAAQLVRVSAESLREPGINDLIYRPPINEAWRDAWNVSEAEILRVERNVQTHRALFLLVIIGTGVQLEPNSTFQEGYLQAVGGTDLLYPSHRLTALATRNGFAVLDLVPPMKVYAQEHQVYFHGFANTAPGTGHWNERGNRFAAALIANRLAAMISQGQAQGKKEPGLR